MMYRERRSRSAVRQKLFPTNRPFLAALDFSSLHDDYGSYTMLLRVMLRLTDANNSAAEVFSYAAFQPCVSVLMSTLSRTVAFPHTTLEDLTGEERKIAPLETFIDIGASPTSTCSSDPNMRFSESCVKAFSTSNQGAHFSKVNDTPSLYANGRNEREFGPVSRSDAFFLLGLIVCFFLLAKLIAPTSTLPIAGSVKWYDANTGMQA